MQKKCFLYLDDESIFKGTSFGHCPPKACKLKDSNIELQPAGEVVFNTGMAGYVAIFTDPSYTGQIIVMTYPHIGNYGTIEEWSESGPESKKRNLIKTSGVVVRSLYRGPVPEGRLTLDNFLKNNGVSGITDIDTRQLALKIRNGGNVNGVIVCPSLKNSDFLSKEDLKYLKEFLKSYPKMEGRNLITDVGTDKTVVLNQKGTPHVCVFDCGVKANIIRELIALGCKVTVVPSTFTYAEILKLHTDGVLFSNGPGDPAVLDSVIKCAQGIIGKKPLLGICLGHQVIALALGARTFKMKFGHHGINQPVRDERTGRIIITSQNHGFAIEEKSLSPDIKVLFRNVNDSSIEGIIHKKLPLITAQFHPESAPGPRDSLWIFKEFLDLIA